MTESDGSSGARVTPSADSATADNLLIGVVGDAQNMLFRRLRCSALIPAEQREKGLERRQNRGTDPRRPFRRLVNDHALSAPASTPEQLSHDDRPRTMAS